MTRMEEEEVQVARIRGLQAIYRVEHEALIQWGRWSMDDHEPPKDIEPPGTFEDYRSEEEWADPAPPDVRTRYDAKLAELLDARIHGFGGMPYEVRHMLRLIYINSAIPERELPRRCACSWDGLCERLEWAYMFVGRWLW